MAAHLKRVGPPRTARLRRPADVIDDTYGWCDIATHLKTTINDQLLEAARTAASRDKTTVTSLAEEGLRRLLVARQERPAYGLRKATFKGRGLRKELEGSGWEKIRDRACEGRGA